MCDVHFGGVAAEFHERLESVDVELVVVDKEDIRAIALLLKFLFGLKWVIRLLEARVGHFDLHN